MDDAAKKNRANQLNPYHIEFWRSRRLEKPAHDDIPAKLLELYPCCMTKADLDNRSQQLDPYNAKFWKSRSLEMPPRSEIPKELAKLCKCNRLNIFTLEAEMKSDQVETYEPSEKEECQYSCVPQPSTPFEVHGFTTTQYRQVDESSESEEEQFYHDKNQWKPSPRPTPSQTWAMSSSTSTSRSTNQSTAENIALGVGAVVVLGALAYLGYQAFKGDDEDAKKKERRQFY